LLAAGTAGPLLAMVLAACKSHCCRSAARVSWRKRV
jgi:hypothetical protein